MTDLRRAYSSTVVAPWNIVASMAVAAALCAATARLPPPGPAMAAAGAAVIVLAGIHLATVRLTISPERLRLGLVLGSGEYIRVSTPDPEGAARLIGIRDDTSPCRPQEEGTIVTDSERDSAEKGNRPWFGPKRVGWGLRPQTWQGWAIILAVAVAAVVLAIVR